MRWIKTLNEFKRPESIEYYNDFSIDMFPKEIIFDDPSICYKLVSHVLGSNRISLSYSLARSEKDVNPYDGTHPDGLTLDISLIYEKDDECDVNSVKMFVSLIGGQKTWLDFSISDSKISEIERYDGYQLSSKTINELILVYENFKN